MDVIYHRNCMDGAYSAYLLYLFTKSLTPKGYTSFLNHLKSHTDPKLKQFQCEQLLMTEPQSIKQQFFHSKSDIQFHSISMYAGDLFPISPSNNQNILVMVDITPSTSEMMQLLAKRFKIVVIFDHHTSFTNCLNFILDAGIKNVFYFWDQTKCAAQIVQNYLFQGFGFPKNLPKDIYFQLQQQIKHVASNDLKIDQCSISKQFTLGFYYFEIELSHHNPLLFKRLWQLKLQTIFQKGKNVYKGHLQMLQKQIQTCQLWQIRKCKFKNERFLGAPVTDRGLVSDLGSVLAHLSVKLNYANLGMIYKKGHNEYRISFRSQKFMKQPQALKFSQLFGGGGHTHAAGCVIGKANFTHHFHLLGHLKPSIQISTQQIEKILFRKHQYD